MPNSSCPKQNKLNGIFVGFFLFHSAFSGFSLFLQVFAYALWFLILFFMSFLCVRMVCVSMFVCLCFYFGVFALLVYLFCPILICFINYLDACLYSNEEEKERVCLGWVQQDLGRAEEEKL